MMKKLIIFLFLISIQYNYAQKDLELAGTKWKFHVTEKAFNYIIFKADSEYLEYDCELEEKFFGKYVVMSDTVILLQEKGEYDDEFPEGSRHREGKKEDILLFKDEKLIRGKEMKIEYIKDKTFDDEQFNKR